MSEGGVLLPIDLGVKMYYIVLQRKTKEAIEYEHRTFSKITR